MLIDLLNTSNYVSYNIKVAEVLGLHSAIYISEIMSINCKAIKKQKIDDQVFTLDRDYIRSRTTLDKEEQLDIEKNLIKIGLLEKPSSENQDCIQLNISVLTALIMAEDEELIDSIKKLNKPKNTRKATKKEKIKQELKNNVIVNNEELREAYYSWIDTVYEKQGWMSKTAVVEAQAIIDNFSQRNLDLALEVIKIADTNGYRDMNWAVTKYKNNYGVTYKFNNIQVPQVSPARVSLSEEVF